MQRAEENRPNQGRVLGAFIEAALTNTGRTRADFARAMDMDADVVDALLDGDLPGALLRDRTLVDIARVIDYDANLLRALLGRPITPTHDKDRAQNST